MRGSTDYRQVKAMDEGNKTWFVKGKEQEFQEAIKKLAGDETGSFGFY